MFWSAEVRSRQADSPLCPARPRCPHLLPGEPPTTLGANGFHTQRREVGTGARLAEQLAPDQLAAQCGEHEPVDLIRAAVFEDRRRPPPSDDEVRPVDTGARPPL